MNKIKIDTTLIWQLLEEIPDPEIPVVSIVDLGMIRNVYKQVDKIIIELAPTYSGCPALNTIEEDIYQKMLDHDIKSIMVVKKISPPWTTDWISDSGRKKLKKYGIAPPQHTTIDKSTLLEEPRINCPRCDSTNTEIISVFGSTPCKALYKCLDCLEPFDYFKCH